MNLKFIYFLLWIAPVSILARSANPSPSNSSPLVLQESFVCYGSSATFSSTLEYVKEYQLQYKDSNGDWKFTGYNGFPIYGPSQGITINIPVFITSADYRLLLIQDALTAYSNEIYVKAERPEFTIQPLNSTNCSSNVINLYVDNFGTGYTYQWQRNPGGTGSFSNISDGSLSISGTNTNNFKISSASISNHNQDLYRCEVSTSNGCKNTSYAAKITVNSLGAIQPANSSNLCIGGNANFYPLNQNGNALLYNWQVNEGSGYYAPAESATYQNVETDQLTINGIKTGFSAIKLSVTFDRILMSSSGVSSTTSCIVTNSRTYTNITSQPPGPSLIIADSVCGHGIMNLEVSDTRTEFFWFSDINLPSIHAGKTFTTSDISSTTSYYVRYTDPVSACNSLFTEVVAKVNEIPAIDILPSTDICPSSGTFEIPYYSVSGGASIFDLSNNDASLSGFTSISDQSISTSPLSVIIPNPATPGDHVFTLIAENSISHCYSPPYEVNLHIKSPTLITSSPSTQALCEDDPLDLNVAGTGEGALTYSWFFEGNPFTGFNTDNLHFNKTSLSQAGEYYAKISGECGVAESEKAIITVNPKTKITLDPVASSVCVGKDVSFEADATGTGTISYQWQKNGINIGSNSPTLDLTSLDLKDDQAEIRCIASSDCGKDTSEIAILTVNDLPAKPAVSSSFYFCQNSVSTNLTATPLGSNSLNWYENVMDISPLSSAPTPATNDIGNTSYFVSQMDENTCESEKAEIIVTILEPVTINLSSSTTSVCAWGNLNKEVLFYSSPSGGNGIYEYEWSKDNVIIASETTDEYLGKGSGIYALKVTSGACTAISSITVTNLLLENELGPDIKVNGKLADSPFEVCEGSEVTLIAESGIASAQIYWYADETTSSKLRSADDYTVSNVTLAQTYYVSAATYSGLVECETKRTQFKVQSFEKPDVTLSTIDASCNYNTDGELNISNPGINTPYSYSLNNTDFQSTSNFNQLSPNNYTLYIRDKNNCEAQKTFNITSGLSPEITVQPSNQNNCKGNTVNFEVTAANANYYQWQRQLTGGNWTNIVSFTGLSGETTNKLKVSSAGNTNNPGLTKYRAIVSNGTCETISDYAILTINELTSTLDDQEACIGEALTFSPPAFNGSASNYLWQRSLNGSGNFLDFQNSSTADLSILSAAITDSNSFYRVKITFDKGDGTTCLITSDNLKLSVYEAPEVTLNGTSEICEGEKVTLSASTCNGILTWSDNQIGSSIEVSPSETTIYTAKCVYKGCEKNALNSVTVTVKSGISALTITSDKSSLCYGENAILSASMCSGSYLWSNLETTQEITVQETGIHTYTVVCQDNGCSSPISNQIVLTGYPQLAPGIIAGTSSVNCAGYNPSAITSSSAASGGKGTLVYSWEMTENCDVVSPDWSIITGASSSTFNPDVLQKTTCYRRGITDDCGGTVYSNILKIEISPDPSVSISADQTQICSGSDVNLFALVSGGAGSCTVTWQKNEKSSAPTSSFWVDMIETGENILLSGLINSTNAAVTTYYRAIYDCSLSSCNKATSASLSISIAPLVAISVDADQTDICSGNEVTLTASNCFGEITWSTSESTAIIKVSPTTTTTYTATCTITGCSISEESSVEISVRPGISKPVISSDVTELCFGESARLSISACTGDIKWINAETTVEIRISPTNTVTYTASCTVDGCESPPSDPISIAGHPQLLAGTISGSAGVNCAGYNPSAFTNSSAASGGKGTLVYSWEMTENCDVVSPDWSIITGASSSTFNPDVLQKTTCYRRGITDDCGGTVYSNILKIEISPDPSVSISADQTQICSGSDVNLFALVSGGAGSCTVTWQKNEKSSAPTSSFWVDMIETGGNILLSGLINSTNAAVTTYYRAIYDCSLSSCNKATSASLGINIAPLVTISVDADQTDICGGNEVTLTASNCFGEITWSTSESNAIIKVSPTTTTTYTAICTITGCSISEESSVEISVRPGISKPVISSDVTELCFGESARLSISACTGDIKWSNAETTVEIRISPTNTVTYTASCTVDGCESPVSNEITIIGNPELIPGTISSSSVINCAGYNPPAFTSSLAATGGKGTLVYSWEMTENCDVVSPDWSIITGASSSTFNPDVLQKTTCYRRGITDDCGSTIYSNVLKIEISPDPSVSISADQTRICSGSDVNLSALISGGAGTCRVTWQKNEKSSAPTSSFWVDMTETGENIFTNSLINSLEISKNIYLRAIYDCTLSSCNKSTSEPISIEILPSFEFTLNFNDSIICSGNDVLVKFSNCSGTISWSDGLNELERIFSPTDNISYTATCTNSCGSHSEEVNFTVIPGLSAPVSTTPPTKVFPQILEFSASGNKLIWYSDETFNTKLSSAPIENDTGNYTYWVSQSNGTCESPKTQIVATLYPQLTIINSTGNQVDCEGNSVNFAVEAEGAGKMYYQWQRKRPDESQFSNLLASNKGIKYYNQPFLRVSSVGNSENPNGTLYRCQITDSLGVMYSREMKLIANVLNRTLPNLKTCIGSDFQIALHDFIEVTGDVAGYNWQIRDDAAGEWLDITDDFHVYGSKTSILSFHDIKPAHSRKYRCQVFFETGGFKCTENTDQTALSVGTYPETPPNQYAEYCLNKTTKTLSFKADSGNDDIWYYSEFADAAYGTSKAPKPFSDEAGTQIYWYTQRTDEGCESKRAKYTVSIHPLPFPPGNTTPEYVKEGQTLTFTAAGAYLKWYTSLKGTKFQETNPTYTKVDNYDHYVSQSSEYGCESERTYISAYIEGALGFKSDIKSLAECEGNSLTFRASGKGKGSLSYRWEKKTPGSENYTKVPDSNKNSLKIDDAGDIDNPDQTLYRCIIYDESGDSAFSNEAQLTVNILNADLNDINICESSPWVLDEKSVKYKGELINFQLQKQSGNSWTIVDSSFVLNQKQSPLNLADAGDYRLRAVFESETSTCTRNTKEFSISVHEKPKSPGNRSLELCQYQEITEESLIGNNAAENIFWKTSEWDNIFTEVPALSTKEPESNQIFRYAAINSKGCISDLDSMVISINEVLNLLVDSTFQFCQFENATSLVLSDEFPVLWRNATSPDDSFDSSPVIKTNYTGEYQYFASITNKNGCQSPEAEITISVTTCIVSYQSEDNSCKEINVTVSGNEWVYFRNDTQVVLAINANGQNLGLVNLSYRIHDPQQSFETNHGTVLLPRYFDLTAQYPPAEPVDIRVFFTNEEIDEYLSGMANFKSNSVQLLHYEGKNEDCTFENNDNFSEGESWVIGSDYQLISLNEQVSYLEFQASSFSEFGFTNNNFAELGNFEISEESSLYWTLSENYNGKYLVIERSKNGKDWIQLDTLEVSAVNYIDPLPFSGESFYRIIFVDQDGTQKIIGDKVYNLPNDKVICKVFSNPVQSGQKAKIYYQNLDTPVFNLFDVVGKSIPVKMEYTENSYQNIRLNSEITEGIYILKGIDESGRTCSLRLAVKK